MKLLFVSVVFLALYVRYSKCNNATMSETFQESRAKLVEEIRCLKKKMCSCMVERSFCPIGFLKNDSMCYWFSPIGLLLTWPDAKVACETMNSYLAVITNPTEDEFVRNYLNVFYSTDKYWLGAHDLKVEGDFQWSSKGPQFPLTYTNWISGKPDNLGTNANCIVMEWSSNFQWMDHRCDKNRALVCMQSLEFLLCPP